MNIVEEIIKEAEDRVNGFIVISGDAAFSSDELEIVVNKVLDAAVVVAKHEISQLDCVYGEPWDIVYAINNLRPNK